MAMLFTSTLSTVRPRHACPEHAFHADAKHQSSCDVLGPSKCFETRRTFAGEGDATTVFAAGELLPEHCS